MKQCKKKRQKWNQIGTAYADKPEGEEGEEQESEWDEEDDAYDDE